MSLYEDWFSLNHLYIQTGWVEKVETGPTYFTPTTDKIGK